LHPATPEGWIKGQGALVTSRPFTLVSECNKNDTSEVLVKTELKPSLTHPKGSAGWLPVQPLAGITMPPGLLIVPGSRSKKVGKRVVRDGSTVEFAGALRVSPHSSTFAPPQVGTVEPEGPTRPPVVSVVTVIVSVLSLTMIVFIVSALAD